MIGITEDDNGTKMRTKRRIEKDKEDIISESREELNAIWELIVQAAIDLCLVDTGALRSTIKTSESGGEGAISATSMASSDFFNKSLVAGDDSIINWKTGKATSEYAGLVHDGHAMRNGIFWEGVPFLVEALLMYEEELERAIDRAVQNLQAGSE